MRKSLDAASLVAVFVVWTIALFACFGTHPLAERIPTRFDAAGHPTEWASRLILWLLPAVAIFLYLLLTVLARFPNACNYPVRVTPENREALQSLSLDMVGWIKAELTWLFAGLQYVIIHGLRGGHGSPPPLLLPLGIAAVWGTAIWYIVAMFRVKGRC